MGFQDLDSATSLESKLQVLTQVYKSSELGNSGHWPSHKLVFISHLLLSLVCKFYLGACWRAGWLAGIFRSLTLIPAPHKNLPKLYRLTWLTSYVTDTEQSVISETQAVYCGTPGKHTFDLMALGNVCVFRFLFQTVQEMALDCREHWELSDACDRAGPGCIATLHRETDGRTG